jgi:protein gp37
MGIDSSIEWTEATWNPVTGCTKISTGCKFCYAERMAKRLRAMRQPHYQNGFKLTLHQDALELPLSWKRPRRVFVNSMSDLFHRSIPDNFLLKTFDVMRRASWHEFQVLTKRAERLRDTAPRLSWAENIWMGVSVENDQTRFRIDDLRITLAKIKFLSIEPLLGPLNDLDLSGIDWVIAGGESGPHARPMCASWVTDIRDQCLKARVSFFFKQWGGSRKKLAGRVLDGRTWDEMPLSRDLQGKKQSLNQS